MKKNKVIWIGILCVAFFLFILLAEGVNYFQVRKSVSHLAEDAEPYLAHYAFIAEDTSETALMEVYQQARAYAAEEHIYVENYTETLVGDYSKETLLHMAVMSEVDGIILQADDTEEITELIDQAVERGIPVVTVLQDSPDSRRNCFIGIGTYNLGREYARQIIRIATKETEKVLVFNEKETNDNSKNLIYTAISETLVNEGNHLTVAIDTMMLDKNSNTFSAQEAIRDVLMDTDNLPDIIVCLDEETTMSVYQALVDYNMVGQVSVLGYDISDVILNGIKKEGIASTMAIDFGQMGRSCINALDEYRKTGYVSDYVALDAKAITKKNVGEYIADDH